MRSVEHSHLLSITVIFAVKIMENRYETIYIVIEEIIHTGDTANGFLLFSKFDDSTKLLRTLTTTILNCLFIRRTGLKDVCLMQYYYECTFVLLMCH